MFIRINSQLVNPDHITRLVRADTSGELHLSSGPPVFLTGADCDRIEAFLKPVDLPAVKPADPAGEAATPSAGEPDSGDTGDRPARRKRS